MFATIELVPSAETLFMVIVGLMFLAKWIHKASPKVTDVAKEAASNKAISLIQRLLK